MSPSRRPRLLFPIALLGATTPGRAELPPAFPGERNGAAALQPDLGHKPKANPPLPAETCSHKRHYFSIVSFRGWEAFRAAASGGALAGGSPGPAERPVASGPLPRRRRAPGTIQRGPLAPFASPAKSTAGLRAELHPPGGETRAAAPAPPRRKAKGLPPPASNGGGCEGERGKGRLQGAESGDGGAGEQGGS